MPLTTTVATPLGDLTLDAWTLAWAAIAVIVTFLTARFAAKGTMRLVGRLQGVQDDLALQASRIARYSVLVVGAGVVLQIVGASIQPLLMALIIVAAGLALMARGIADNFGAGLVIQVRRPLHLGDLIESLGYTGHVTDLNSRSVVLETADGRQVHLPNGRLMDNPMVNLSTRGQVRTDLLARFASDGPVPAERIERLSADLVSAARSTRGVLATAAPQALLCATDGAQVTFLVRFWHDPDATQLVSARATAALHAISLADGRLSVTWLPPVPGIAPSAWSYPAGLQQLEHPSNHEQDAEDHE